MEEELILVSFQKHLTRILEFSTIHPQFIKS